MDIQDFVPAGGGSLRGFPATTSEPVATFTQTQTVHPDSIWRPLGGEFDQGRVPSVRNSADDQTGQRDDASADRPGADTSDGYNFQSTARMVRSALNPGD
jgi:hypothetical protein